MSMNESPLPAFHINNHSNISFAPMIFPGESVMVLPAQWVFSQFNASRPNPFDAMSDILGTSFQTTPLSMVPASTMSLGLSTTPTEGTGPSVMMDSMAGYGDSARLEAQVREQDLSFNIAMATQDQRPLYFVLSYPQPSSIPHVLASPQQLLQPLQSAEKHIQDILMASDKFSTDHNTGSVDDYHLAPSGMATISPADTMNALSSALSPAMMNVNTPLPNMIDSPYLPTKDEPVDDNDYDFDDTDNNEDNINDSESDIETEDNDKEYRGKERSSSIDTIHLYGSDSHDAEQKLSPNTCSEAI
ncbi:hypothetical protein FBU30_005229 [Linnemannia zychae]|nr:hypothetical protein FBU30_005229 [Linnemannia zychae]